VRLMAEDWTRPGKAPGAKPADAIKRKISDSSPAAFESDVLKAGLALRGSIIEERAAHTGGGKDASALFNGTTKNGSGGNDTKDDGKTFRGYGAGSVLTVNLTSAHNLTEIRTFGGHADGRASQNYTLFVAHSAEPKKFTKLATATLRCDGGASELRVPAEASAVVAVRFEFQDGPTGFNVYREINLVGEPSKQE
jgi:hypothetical protein